MKRFSNLSFTMLSLLASNIVEGATSSLRNSRKLTNPTCTNSLMARCAINNETIFKKTATLNAAVEEEIQHCYEENTDGFEDITLPTYHGMSNLANYGYNKFEIVPANTTCGTGLKFTASATEGNMILSEIQFFNQEYIDEYPNPPRSNFTISIEYKGDRCSCRTPCVPDPDDPGYCLDFDTIETEHDSVTVLIQSCPHVMDYLCTRDSSNMYGVDEMTITLDLCDFFGGSLNCCNIHSHDMYYFVSRFTTKRGRLGPRKFSFGEGISTSTFEAYTPFMIECDDPDAAQ